jgi:hypothetical protein
MLAAPDARRRGSAVLGDGRPTHRRASYPQPTDRHATPARSGTTMPANLGAVGMPLQVRLMPSPSIVTGFPLLVIFRTMVTERRFVTPSSKINLYVAVVACVFTVFQ